MLASIVFIGAVMCGVGFMAWLAFFVLIRGFNTFLETDRESRRISRNYLVVGGLLLAGAIGLGFQYSTMESPLPKPELGPGMPVQLIEQRKAAKDKAAEAAAAASAHAATANAIMEGTGEE